MTTLTAGPVRLTYRNPVHSGVFADPFALRVETPDGPVYFAFGTAPPDSQGRQFPVLTTTDLVHWRPLTHALTPIPDGHHYWAPEVAIGPDGRYFLYYSASTTPSDDSHRLRVAIADRPEGPYTDSGRVLLPDAGFSIDAHPFHDPASGRRFLFYACDFEHDEPHGTGLSVVELEQDMMTPRGSPRTVVRAVGDWQVYERDREYKGRVWRAWHCVEGPFVLHRNGQYFCLYSGGAWHTDQYGLGFAVADDPLGPWRDDMGPHGPTVLHALPGRVLGPGHNSVVLGPDDRTLVCLYHAWDPARTGRRLCADPLHWTPTGPKVDGPSDFDRTPVWLP